MNRKLLWASTAMAVASASTALAQTTAAAPAQEAAGSTSIQEIVVTAQRFTETAQRAPIVISVISPTQLKGVTELRQLQSVDPGVQLGSAGGTTQTFVRGVGSLNAGATQESSVAYNADGVFLFTPTMVTPLLYDLERIEVLKGPQGTLYGRNASGGAVNIITTGASLDKTSGYLEGELGDYNLRRVVGAVNVPVSSTLAVRIAGEHVQHHGYLSDGTDDQDLSAGRLRVLWEPSSEVTLKVGVDGAKIDQRGPGSTVTPNPTGEKFIGSLDPRLDTGPFFLGGTSLLSQPPNPAPYYKDSMWSANAQLDVNLGFATLTVLPAYREENLRYREYANGYEDTQNPLSRQKSIEARLGNNTDKLRWVVGGYYFRINQDLSAIHIRNELNFQNAVVDEKTKVSSYAFFGDGTFSITDKLRLIGGLRYSHEQSSATGAVNALIGPPIVNPLTGQPNMQTAAFNPFNPITNPTGELLDYPFANSTSASAVTWRAGVQYDLTPTSMIFATASRGFKGGGTYVDVPGTDQTFRPEFLTAYEFGSRNRFFDNTLQLNGELFYWKLTDQQIPYVGFDSIGQVTYLTANAGKAHMYGADVSVEWRATPNDTFSAGVEYLQSEYDAFTRTIPSAVVIQPTHCTVTGYNPTPGSLAPATVDCSGLPVLRAPRWASTASYQHRFDLETAGSLLADFDISYASSRYMDPVYTDIYKQPGRAVANASLTYMAPNKAVSVTAWIRNIGNVLVFAGGGQVVPTYARPSVQPPRTFGASVRYSF